MKKLTDLNPEWSGCLRPGPASGESVMFDCPTCGPKHRCVAYFRNPRDGQEPNGWTPKWDRKGDTFDALTLEPSINYGCWHGWIEEGLVWDVAESPLVVLGSQIGIKDVPFVHLSPMLAERFARAVLERVAEMKGKKPVVALVKP